MSLFLLCELSHFLTSMYRQWVSCECKSSYNFIPIFLKLCTCFLHDLKMCMWFGYNHCINFCHFFHFPNCVISWPQILWKCVDSGYLVSATPHTILNRSFWNFARFCHGLEMCMWFGYNPWINFCHFFHLVNFVIFWPQIRPDMTEKLLTGTLSLNTTNLTSDSMKVYRLWVPCKRNSLYNFMPIFIQLCTCFCHGLEMCMWFGFNPAVNFCHFSTLSFFAGATSTSPKFDLYLWRNNKNCP